MKKSKKTSSSITFQSRFSLKFKTMFYFRKLDLDEKHALFIKKKYTK